jgi:hypothetical protein
MKVFALLLGVLLLVGSYSLGRSDSRSSAPRKAAATRAAIPEATTAPAPTVAPARAKARPNKRNRPTMVACDANIKVKASTTSCEFGQNAFLSFWINEQDPSLFDGDDLPAHSPVSDQMYDVSCSSSSAGRVECLASDGGQVSFPADAVSAYTLAHAERFLENHDTGGIGTDYLRSLESGASPSGGYDDSHDPVYSNEPEPGYEAPDDEPDYSYGAPTTENFGNGKGCVGVCADGTLSDSIGRPGACSHHGGVG